MDGASCTFNASMGGSDTCSAFAVGPAVHFPFPLNAKGRCPLDTRAYAAGTKGRCPLESRWGIAPDPEMLTHLCFACGRDGGLGASPVHAALLTSPHKGLRAGRFFAAVFFVSVFLPVSLTSHSRPGLFGLLMLVQGYVPPSARQPRRGISFF